MQRAKGLVPTKINKDFVATGDTKIKPQKDWSALIKQTEEKRKGGKPLTKLTEKISHQRASIDKGTKQIIAKAKEKPKEHDKDGHDH